MNDILSYINAELCIYTFIVNMLIFSAWAFHGLPRHALAAQPHVSPATGTHGHRGHGTSEAPNASTVNVPTRFTNGKLKYG